MSKPTNAEAASARIQQASFNAKLARDKLDEVYEVAQGLAPCFRDKFDFSKNEDYDKMADMAYLAAEALLNKRKAALNSISEKYEIDVEAARKLDAKDAEAKKEATV